MLNGLIAERIVLRLAGTEARDFLQGLVTNDLDRVQGEEAVYAALLTPQGKFLFDFLMLADGLEAVLLDVAAAQAKGLAQRLAMYRLRREVEIADSGLRVGLAWPAEEGAPTEASLDAPEAPEGARLVRDPRDPSLGWRIYAQDPAAALTALGATPASSRDYAARRVAAGVPEAGLELTPDSFVLEAGFERLGGVDFRKGCFVGQEVVARMKHKTQLRKGLVRVAVEGEAPEPGAQVLTAEGKPAGSLYTVVGGRGLAHLRFDRAEGELTAGSARLRRI